MSQTNYFDELFGEDIDRLINDISVGGRFSCLNAYDYPNIFSGRYNNYKRPNEQFVDLGLARPCIPGMVGWAHI